MPKQVTTAASNRYCQARLRASTFNSAFLTRPTAVEHLPGVTEESLKKYELDLTRPPNTVVALMADAYNEPELRAWYCANECPLGKDCREIQEMPPERVLIRLLNSSKEISETAAVLSAIMDDGVVDDSEAMMIPELRARLLEARRRMDESLAILEKAERSGNFE